MSKEKIENVTEKEGTKINVKILNIKNGLTEYNNVKIIKVKSEKYSIVIMEDYLPVIGEVEGDVEIITEDNIVKFKDIVGYYMHKHNQFKLFIKEE
ncbi:MAG TPA: hypothetical protein IAB70_05330 [Candidatus Merdicola faecigallinarum]|uniref:Uncharacterized protein n=1 Tax=Candidatus Merdicola faecigallinarum TaxID=2840862 RepID=A0A9D1M1V5_9FIRM|nr:hypothetical protein [Candidatus Merdicola faecigallinarum]